MEPKSDPLPIAKRLRLLIYEPFGLGRFATDHSLTKAASRPLFARVRRYAPQGDH